MAKKKYTVKASTTAKRKPTRAQAVKASKTPVKADWASNGKKKKISKSFELGNFFLFELGKDFIGVSINNSYPDGKAWLGARTIKCADADGLFAYLQKNLTDNATWNQIERTIANSGFEAKIDNMGGFVSDKDMNKPAKSVETACNKRRAVKASDVDADRPNSAPNSWKSNQRMAYKVTEDQTKGERSFPTHIDDVYKVLGEMQGTWTNPTTGWTGDCEIYERDLDDGSYIFSLVFGGNELEPDDILYVPGGFDYYSNKPKFTIYPHSGAPTFADSIEDFKRKLKKEYSYLRKVDDASSSVKASATLEQENDQEIVLRDDDGAQLRVVKHPTVNGYRLRRTLNNTNGDSFEWDLSKEIYDTPEEAKQAALDGKATFHFKGQNEVPHKPVQSSTKKHTVKASAIAKKRASMRVVAAEDVEDKMFTVSLYYDDKFRDLAGSEEFKDLSDAESYAHEYLDEFCVAIEYPDVDTLYINPDIYWDNFDGEFACTPEIAEWQNAVWRSMGIDASTKAVKAGINAPSTDGPLCVCENCKAEIESREGRQTVYNVISDLDIEPDEKLICDWCEDEVTELYQISPDDVEGATSDDELEPIMGDGFAEDLGFGFDSNGDPIDESTVEELERIAQEIVYKSEIAKYDEYADVHNFDYYVSSPYVSEKFDLTFTPEFTSDQMWSNGVVSNNQSGWDTSATYKLYINVRIKSGEVADISLNDVDMRNSYAVDSALRNIDDVAIKNWVGKLVAPVAMQIYNATSNI